LFDLNSTVTDTILDVFPALITKMTSAVEEDITIFCQSLDNGGIGHFMWSIKNLQVCKGTINILKCKGLVANFDNIVAEELFFGSRPLQKVNMISPEDERWMHETLVLSTPEVCKA